MSTRKDFDVPGCSVNNHQAWDEDSPSVLRDEDEDFQGYEDEDKDEDSVYIVIVPEDEDADKLNYPEEDNLSSWGQPVILFDADLCKGV